MDHSTDQMNLLGDDQAARIASAEQRGLMKCGECFLIDFSGRDTLEALLGGSGRIEKDVQRHLLERGIQTRAPALSYWNLNQSKLGGPGKAAQMS